MSVSSVEKTLIFFDLFDHPLTAWELWRWLWREQLNFTDMPKKIKEFPTIEAGAGFYFLSSRRESSLWRGRRQIWNDVKMRQARRAARWINWLPFVRLAAVCNTVNLGVAQEESDIDFFVVVADGRLWLTRFLMSVVLRLARLRTYGLRTKDRVCLSFFLSDDSLDVAGLALPEEAGQPDIYLIYWLTQLAPLINREQTLEKFWQANSWVSQYLPNFSFAGLAESRQEIGEGGLARGVRKFLELIFFGWLGDRLEKFFFQWQEQRLRERLAAKIGSGGVALGPKIIKLHENDRRAFYRCRWLEKIKQYENGQVGE